MELCDSLSVVENVSLGFECPQAGARVFRQIVASAAERRAMDIMTREALALCGIERIANTQVGALSTGHRRLVELARCLAGPFSMLLLDEPSSGLDRAETDAFGAVLVRVAEERRCGLLLVEHDMSLVMRVCSNVYVFDFGRLIAGGTPDEISTSSVVRSAYLGSDFRIADAERYDVAQRPGS
jgi:ABC-type branched-subunit amino acid transport system ATPase component